MAKKTHEKMLYAFMTISGHEENANQATLMGRGLGSSEEVW
jgi:hypothetical protein